MNELVAIFRMSEISIATRCRLIIRLGEYINDQYGMNMTEALVYELILALDPTHEILINPHYKSAAGIK